MKNLFVRTLSIVFFFNIIINLSSAQLTSAQIDSLVEEGMASFQVVGAAVAVVKDGKILHNKGYGVKSAATNEKVDQHTMFAIASNSKAFTSTALAILVEEGKIKWTDKVVDHIPEFKMYNAYVTANFNIQDLLTHRSGLGLGIGDLMFFPDGSDFTMDDLLSSFQYFQPTSAFRTKFDYDNLLYLVAGEIIARKSGMTWEDFIKIRIMDPLGMDNSYPSLADIPEGANLASPHSTVEGQWKVLPDFEEMLNGAAGGIYANVDDLSNWMLVHLNKGIYGDKQANQLFSEESQNEMWKIHSTLDVNRNPRYNVHFSGYGLGWGLQDVKGNMMVSHTGGLPGMLSKTLLIPDLNLGIVVLSNTEPGGAGLFSAVTNTIMDSYLGLNDFGWTEKYSRFLITRSEIGDSVTTKVWEEIESADDSHINIEDYLGVYEDNWFGKAEVFMKGDQLWFKCYRSPKLNGPMHYYRANTFAIRWEYRDMNADAFAMFRLDENGVAEGIKMKGISPNIDFSFDFHDLDFKRVNMKENLD